MSSLDVIKGFLCLVSLYALLRLIHHQQIKGQALFLGSEFVDVLFRHPAQLGEFAAEIDGAFQILQGNEGDHAFFCSALLLEVFFSCQHARLAAQGIGIADEAEIVLPTDELVEILRPGVGDAGAVGDDQDPLEAHADDQIIGTQGLAEAGLGVPEKLLPALGEPFLRHGHRFFLFFPQGVGQTRFAL